MQIRPFKTRVGVKRDVSETRTYYVYDVSAAAERKEKGVYMARERDNSGVTRITAIERES